MPLDGESHIPAGVSENGSHHGIRNLQWRDANRAVISAAAFVSEKFDTWCGSYQSKNPSRRNLVGSSAEKGGATEVAPQDITLPSCRRFFAHG